jgi:hypothetical protein
VPKSAGLIPFRFQAEAIPSPRPSPSDGERVSEGRVRGRMVVSECGVNRNLNAHWNKTEHSLAEHLPDGALAERSLCTLILVLVAPIVSRARPLRARSPRCGAGR